MGIRVFTAQRRIEEMGALSSAVCPYFLPCRACVSNDLTSLTVVFLSEVISSVGFATIVDRLEKNIKKLNNQYKAYKCFDFILIVIKVKAKCLFISVSYMQIFNIIDFIFAA